MTYFEQFKEISEKESLDLKISGDKVDCKLIYSDGTASKNVAFSLLKSDLGISPENSRLSLNQAKLDKIIAAANSKISGTKIKAPFLPENESIMAEIKDDKIEFEIDPNTNVISIVNKPV